MARILNIDTSTEVCSVCISEEGKILSIREDRQGKNHASLLTVFIEETLKEAGLESRELSAVSVSKGPGSYTGLRIGVSAGKGIAYALDIPLIAPGTLDIMRSGYLSQNSAREDTLYVPMIDARRMEVYNAVYNHKGERIREVNAEVISPDSFQEFIPEHTIVLFGNGASKCREILGGKHFNFHEQFRHSSSHMIHISESRFEKSIFEDVAYFEPFYLKDFIATTPKNKVF